MARVLLCDEGDFDVQAMTCAAPYYGDAPTVLPVMAIDDAVLLGWQLAFLWSIAFGIRVMRRLISRA